MTATVAERALITNEKQRKRFYLDITKKRHYRN